MRIPHRHASQGPRTDARRAVTAAVTAVCALGIVGCATDVGGAAHPDAAATTAEVAGAARATRRLDDRQRARHVAGA